MALRTKDSAAATRPTVMWMNLSGVPAALVMIRFGDWRFQFLVDTDPPSGLLRDLVDVVERCAA